MKRELSILIPTHDYACYRLVADLHSQAERLDIPYEILVAEDGSRSQVAIIANHKMTELSHCRHIRRHENLGLAATRNELAAMARYDWLLIIDSDAAVDNDDFLKNYVQHIGEAPVVVGGLHHPPVNHNPHATLRYKYEREADRHRSAAERSLRPYAKLTCFNILLHRPTFMQIQFDKDCHEYGYEDALFGVELEQRHVPILHIDNPLVHMGLDTNEAFLRKSETALRTLKGLHGRMNGRSYVENAYNRLCSLRLAWALRLAFRLFRPLLRRNLLGPRPSLALFSLYKLGYYATLCQPTAQPTGAPAPTPSE